MNVVCVYKSRVPGWFGATAITLYPFIFLGLAKADAVEILKHEIVHVRDVRALGWFRFYWKYVWEYVAWRLKGLDDDLAYRTISFEKKAYEISKDVVFTTAEKKELQLEA